MSITKMMKSHDLFKALSFEAVDNVSTFSGTKSYDANEIIFEQRGYGSHFFVVLEGRVKLMLRTSDGESILVVARLENGDIFGISPILGFERYSTTAQCASQATVLAIEAKPFMTVLEQNSDVGLGIMTIVAKAYFSRYIETLRRVQHIFNELSSS
jgi:CRP-like cAMP-binding protein